MLTPFVKIQYMYVMVQDVEDDDEEDSDDEENEGGEGEGGTPPALLACVLAWCKVCIMYCCGYDCAEALLSVDSSAAQPSSVPRPRPRPLSFWSSLQIHLALG